MNKWEGREEQDIVIDVRCPSPVPNRLYAAYEANSDVQLNRSQSVLSAVLKNCEYI